MNDKNLMTSGDYRKKIIYFALPIFLGNLFQQFYNTADSLIVGNFLGSSALAAVSSTGSLIFLLIGFFLGFSSGSGVIIAREIGARNEENTSKAVHTAVVLGILFSIGMTAAGVLFAEPMLRMIGIPESVFREASLYVRIYFAGAAGLVMYNIMVGILQAAGDSRHPLYYLITSSLINIVLDLLFIAVFHMGVEGAALATIISQFVSMFLVYQRLRHVDAAYRIDLTKLRIAPEFLKEIFAYGLLAAWGLLPQMMQEYKRTRLSFQARGIHVYPFSPALLTTLMVKSTRWSEELSIAMESKGFSGYEKRTSFEPERVRARDIAFLALTCVILPAAAIMLFR